MKITKRQLRRIIKEEKTNLLSEVSPADMSVHDAAEHYEKERATAMGHTAFSDELYDARDNLLGLVETLDSNDAIVYIDTLIEELARMKNDIERMR